MKEGKRLWLLLAFLLVVVVGFAPSAAAQDAEDPAAAARSANEEARSYYEQAAEMLRIGHLLERTIEKKRLRPVQVEKARNRPRFDMFL